LRYAAEAANGATKVQRISLLSRGRATFFFHERSKKLLLPHSQALFLIADSAD
jgi:hypothetical protein